MFRLASVPHLHPKGREVLYREANYNYNHYNLPFSHIMIIVIISNEDMLKFGKALKAFSNERKFTF